MGEVPKGAKNPRVTGEGNPRWNPNPDKRTIHQRLHALRGKAVAHKCVDCGKQARHWSQIHDTDGTDLENHYVPRCTSCHAKYDYDLVIGPLKERWADPEFRVRREAELAEKARKQWEPGGSLSKRHIVSRHKETCMCPHCRAAR